MRLAPGLTGVKKLTRLPSGSRSSSDRLPHGMVLSVLAGRPSAKIVATKCGEVEQAYRRLLERASPDGRRGPPQSHARSACGGLLGRKRSKHTEFVAIRVGHHHPAGVGALPYVGTARTESLKPSHLSSLILRS
jgi:hypothetical protein